MVNSPCSVTPPSHQPWVLTYKVQLCPLTSPRFRYRPIHFLRFAIAPVHFQRAAK